MYPAPQGALTQLWAGTSPDTADLNGKVSASSSRTTNDVYGVRCSILSHGRGLANLGATIQNLGKSFGLGLKSRSRMSGTLPNDLGLEVLVQILGPVVT